MTVFLKRNDAGDVIQFVCEDENGIAVDITGSTVKFNMGKKNKLITSGAATITDGTNGKVQYTLTSSDTLTSGNFPAEFEVTFANGNVKTFPTIGYLMVNIEQNLDIGKTTLVQDQIALSVSDITTFKNSINTEITNFESQVNSMIGVTNTYYIDGGNFLDTAPVTSTPIDGGTF